MAQEGFAGGLQIGLSMFNSMQQASYQQQWMQNAEENQQMRREALQLDAQSKAAQQFQQKFDRNKFIIDNASKMGTDMVLDAYNEMNGMMGGRKRINPIEIETFKTDSTAALNAVKGAATDEDANKLITDYRSKAATHPILNEIGNAQVKMMEDARQRKQLVKDLEVLGIGNSQWRDKYVGDGDPNVIRDMVKNNDMRGMMQYQYAQDVMLRHENGGNVSPSELSTAIAFLHTKGGGELKKDGKSIFEPANRAQFHQEVINGVKEAQNTFEPLLGATRVLKPEDVKALNDAANETRTVPGTYDAEKGIFSALGLGSVKHENDAVTQTSQILQKYPQIAQTLQQIGPQAVQNAQTLRRQLEQLERDKKASTAAVTLPNRTEHLERLDQQIAAKREQLAPWETVEAAFNTPESPVAMKGLLALDKRMNKSLDQNEKMRLLNLTESEKNAKKQTDLALKKYHVDDVGPAMVEHELFKWIGENPHSTDEQRLAKASEFGAAYKKQFGLAPDLNKVTQRIVAQRSKAEDTTVTKLTPEQGFKFETAVTGAENTRSLIQGLFPGGKLDRGALATAFAGGLPFTGGRTIQAYIKDALDAEYRARTGAAMPDSEWDRAQDTFVPAQTDNEKTAESKLTNLLRHFENKLNIVDPDSKLRGRVKPITSVGQVAGKSEPQKGFDDFKAFYQQNKGKFKDPDEAATAFFKGQ